MKNGDILFCFAQNAWVDLDSDDLSEMHRATKTEKSGEKVKISFVDKSLKLLESWFESFAFEK